MCFKEINCVAPLLAYPSHPSLEALTQTPDKSVSSLSAVDKCEQACLPPVLGCICTLRNILLNPMVGSFEVGTGEKMGVLLTGF